MSHSFVLTKIHYKGLLPLGFEGPLCMSAGNAFTHLFGNMIVLNRFVVLRGVNSQGGFVLGGTDGFVLGGTDISCLVARTPAKGPTQLLRFTGLSHARAVVPSSVSEANCSVLLRGNVNAREVQNRARSTGRTHANKLFQAQAGGDGSAWVTDPFAGEKFPLPAHCRKCANSRGRPGHNATRKSVGCVPSPGDSAQDFIPDTRIPAACR